MKAGNLLAIVAANKSRDGDQTALATSRLLTSPDPQIERLRFTPVLLAGGGWEYLNEK